MSKNNEPAFPVVAQEPPYYIKEGMTLRDWFASQVINGLCAQPDVLPIDQWDIGYMAQHSYKIADAMLAEREK